MRAYRRDGIGSPRERTGVQPRTARICLHQRGWTRPGSHPGGRRCRALGRASQRRPTRRRPAPSSMRPLMCSRRPSTPAGTATDSRSRAMLAGLSARPAVRSAVPTARGEPTRGRLPAHPLPAATPSGPWSWRSVPASTGAKGDRARCGLPAARARFQRGASAPPAPPGTSGGGGAAGVVRGAMGVIGGGAAPTGDVGVAGTGGVVGAAVGLVTLVVGARRCVGLRVVLAAGVVLGPRRLPRRAACVAAVCRPAAALAAAP